MNTQLSLSQRAARCIRHAASGEATMVVVQAEEIEAAKAMIGDRPVILCDSADARRFLIFMHEKPKKRRM